MDFPLDLMGVKILRIRFFNEAKDGERTAGITIAKIPEQFASEIKGFLKF